MKKNPKGIFEKVQGSAIWWIRYADATGRIRREKIGTKSAAIKLYRKRKTEVLEGEWQPKRLVIVEFPSAEKAKQWWESTEYAGPKAIRQSCSHGEIVLVEGR